MKLVDGRWHCEGCGWRADTKAGPMHGVPLPPSQLGCLDKGSGEAEARRLERRLLKGDFIGKEAAVNLPNLPQGLNLPNLLQGLNLLASMPGSPSPPDGASPPGLEALLGLLQSMKLEDPQQNLDPPCQCCGTSIERANVSRCRFATRVNMLLRLAHARKVYVQPCYAAHPPSALFLPDCISAFFFLSFLFFLHV